MTRFQSKKLRHAIQTVLRDMQRTSPKSSQPGLNYLDAWGKALGDHRRAAAADSRRHMDLDLDLALFGTVAVGLQAMALGAKAGESDKRQLFPDAWIDPSGSPRMDSVLSALLVNITNHALATVRLVEAGLENSARVTLRVVHEACFLTLSVLADQQKLTAYVAAQDTRAARVAWQQYFTPKKLNSVVASIERRLRLRRTTLRLEQVRAENYEFLSQSVHNAYMTSVVLAHAQSFQRPGWWDRGLFGKASKASRGTLRVLIDILAFTLRLLRLVITRLHGLQIPDHDDWEQAETVQEIYVRVSIEVRRRGRKSGDESR